MKLETTAQSIVAMQTNEAALWADLQASNHNCVTPLVDRSETERDQLILENMGVVQQVAKQIRMRVPQHIELDELIAAGTLGLIDAAEKFDVAKDVQFVIYARFRIRGAILDSLRTTDWSPRELRKKNRQVKKAQNDLSTTLGRTPDAEEIAQGLGVGLEDYQRLLTDLNGLDVGSLYIDRGEEQGGEELAQVPAPESESPYAQCCVNEMQARLQAAIQTLPEKERLVIKLRYYEELSVRDVASVLGVVESRVSQIHRSAVDHLKALFSERHDNAGR